MVRYAGFWRRWFALALDLIVLFFAYVFVSAVSKGTATGSLTLLFWLMYSVGLTADGGTLGKRMLRLRVVREDGTPVPVLRAFIREICVKPLSTILLYLGFLWMLDDPQRRTWHDRIAGTIVVVEPPAVAAPAWADSPPWRQNSESQRPLTTPAETN